MPICRRYALALSSLPILTYAMSVQANEYSFEYGIEAGYEYNDNVQLRPDEEIEISGGRVEIPMTLSSRSERLETSLAADFLFSRFDEDAWDSDDQNFRADATYELERGEVDGYAGYRRDTTRTGEFLDTGFTGLEANRRETAIFGGSGRHMFTQTNGILGGLDYQDVDYDAEVLQDFNFVSGYAGWLHRWTERTDIILQAYASYFDNDANTERDIEVETDVIGAEVGLDSRLSENLSTSFLIGWANIDTEYSRALPPVPEDDESSSLLLEASLTYSLERHRLSASLNATPRPSGNGTMVENRSVAVDYRYGLTERSNVRVRLDGGQRSSVDDNFDNDRDFARARFDLDYRFSESWFVSGSYVYSWQDRERFTDSADSNAFYLSVIFRPEKNVWSR